MREALAHVAQFVLLPVALGITLGGGALAVLYLIATAAGWTIT